MPPDVQKMIDQYKEMCSCSVCRKMKTYQESPNRFRRNVLDKFRRNVLDQLKQSHDKSRRRVWEEKSCWSWR